MKRSMIWIVLVLLAAGCGHKEPALVTTDSGAVQDEAQALDNLFTQARACFNEGDTDGAVDLLTEGLADPQFVNDQGTLFRALMELLLREDRVSDAQTNFIAMLNASPETAAQVFGMIPMHLRNQDDPAAYLAWTEQMINTELPSAVVEGAYGFYVDANVQAGKTEPLPLLAKESVARFGGGGASRVLTRPMNDLLAQKEFAAVRNVLDALVETDDKQVADFVTAMEISMAAAEGKWEVVVTLFKERAASLTDAAAKGVLRTTSDRASQSDRPDVIDQLCTYVLSSMPQSQATMEQAVSLYIDVAVKRGDYDDVVTRMRVITEHGDGALLIRKMNTVFYSVMSHASEKSKAVLLTMVEDLLAQAEGSDVDSLHALLMDGAVLCDNYGLALKVLDAGFRADDADWVAMARNKLAAHLALQEGRVDDAVARFRDFMKHVETWTQDTVDPSTGIAYTREMTLGLNAKRIGDIYRDAGRKDEAVQVYAEARTYYDEALQRAREGSKERAHIEKELKVLQDDESALAQ